MVCLSGYRLQILVTLIRIGGVENRQVHSRWMDKQHILVDRLNDSRVCAASSRSVTRQLISARS